MQSFIKYKTFSIFIVAFLAFIIADYEGRYYGLSPILFNQINLPENITIEVDEYETFRFIDNDGFRIAGPGFRMVGSSSKIKAIQKYAISDSSIYIQCITNSGIENYRIELSFKKRLQQQSNI